MTCSGCGQTMPASSFYPSHRDRYGVGVLKCKRCTNRKKESAYLDLARRLYARFGDAQWDASEAGTALGLKLLGMSKLLGALRDRGYVTVQGFSHERNNKYQVNPQSITPQRDDDPPTTPPDRLPIAPPLYPHEPLYLEVGMHYFPPSVLIERDLRGGATVTLPMSEAGALREVKCYPDDWAMRRVVPFSAIGAGEDARALRDRISLLESQLAQSEHDAAKYRKHRRIIDALEQG
jgi:hypothetical protein